MAATIKFHHPAVSPDLTVETGMDEIEWSYSLNTANYPTYGGEVIQILSVYIDDMSIEGTVRTYQKLEGIYEYFAKYITVATQAVYNQEWMTMTYAPRNWTFKIQPLAVPGFIYSRDTIAPKWKMSAHVVDDSSGNYESLKQMAKEAVLNNEEFNLKGIVSMAAADPANNPFSAPGQFKNNKFTAATQTETEAELGNQADYYNTLLPAYLSGDYSSLQGDIARPAFGHSQSEETNTSGETQVAKAQSGAEGELFHG